MQVRLLPGLESQLRSLQATRGLGGRDPAEPGSAKTRTGLVGSPPGHFPAAARPDVKEAVAAWLDLDAERVAEAVALGAGAEVGWPWSIDLSLVVLAPDGDRTDKARTDLQYRFEDAGGLRRGFATVPLWADEPADLDLLRRRTRAAIFRIGHQRLHGLPASLPQMLVQEGRTLHFAGHTPSTTSDEQDAARTVIADLTRRGGAAPSEAVVALLYGDAAAARLGHPPLGVAPGAAWDVAVQDHARG